MVRAYVPCLGEFSHIIVFSCGDESCLGSVHKELANGLVSLVVLKALTRYFVYAYSIQLLQLGILTAAVQLLEHVLILSE